jgi:hypothetical protein
MKNSSLSTAGLALFLCGAEQAMAGTVLLSLIDPAGGTSTPYALLFTAGAPTTDITFAGYQLPSALFATDISLTTGGGGNLLGETWTFTPAPSGSDALQGFDGSGTGTNYLEFLGTTVGAFDQFDQLVSRF